MIGRSEILATPSFTSIFFGSISILQISFYAFRHGIAQKIPRLGEFFELFKIFADIEHIFTYSSALRDR